MARRRHAAIAGGGFAGLVAAIALSQRDWTVRVHEKGEALRAFGAGIFIWENGLRVLKAIGAYDDVIAGSHEAKVYEVRDRGEVVDRTEFSAERGDRMMTMTRQTLYSAILAVAEREEIEFGLNSEVTGATPDGEVSTGNGGRYRADLVVGADGVKSNVRDSLGLQKDREVARPGLVAANFSLLPNSSMNRNAWPPVSARRLCSAASDAGRMLMLVRLAAARACLAARFWCVG